MNVTFLPEGRADVVASCEVNASAAVRPLSQSLLFFSSLFSSTSSAFLHPCSLLPGRSCLFPFEDGFLDDGHVDPSLTPGLNSPTRCQNGERMERYSRKVFVGGLPPDIDEGEDAVISLHTWIIWRIIELSQPQKKHSTGVQRQGKSPYLCSISQ